MSGIKGRGGAKGRSGRKSKAAELGMLEARRGLADRLPVLVATEVSIAAFLRAIVTEVVASRLDTITARELRELASEMRRTVAQKTDRSELDELRKLYGKALALRGAGEKRAALDRQHLADAGATDEPQRATEADPGHPADPGSGGSPSADVGAAARLAQGRG